MLKNWNVQHDNGWIWEERKKGGNQYTCLHCEGSARCPPELHVGSLIPSAVVVGVVGRHEFCPHKRMSVLFPKWVKDHRVGFWQKDQPHPWPWPLSHAHSAMEGYNRKVLARCWRLKMGLSGFQNSRKWISFLYKLPTLWASVMATENTPIQPRLLVPEPPNFQTNKPLED